MISDLNMALSAIQFANVEAKERVKAKNPSSETSIGQAKNLLSSIDLELQELMDRVEELEELL